MKILVATSDNYSFLLEPFYNLFNIFWPEQHIVFLGFDKTKVPKLPNNCDFYSLGRQKDFGKIWSDPLIPFLEKLEDEYFVFTVEDVMLLDYVDMDKIKLLEDEIKFNNASKALLDSHLNKYATPYKKGLMVMNQTAPYRSSLHPAIWKKEYFMKFLKPGYTAWDFEVLNDEEAKFGGEKIISVAQEENLYYTCNVYRKGAIIPRFDCPRPYGTSTDDPPMAPIEYILNFINNKEMINEL